MSMTESEYTNEELIDFMYDVMDWRDAEDTPMIYAVIKALKEREAYRAIGTVSEFRELKEINEKITEAVNGQLIAGKNNYKEVYECFHKIADIVQGRIDWNKGKE